MKHKYHLPGAAQHRSSVTVTVQSIYSLEDTQRMLSDMLRQRGAKTQLCQQLRMSSTRLWQVLAGHRALSPKLESYMGLRRVSMYVGESGRRVYTHEDVRTMVMLQVRQRGTVAALARAWGYEPTTVRIQIARDKYSQRLCSCMGLRRITMYVPLR